MVQQALQVSGLFWTKKQHKKGGARDMRALLLQGFFGQAVQKNINVIILSDYRADIFGTSSIWTQRSMETAFQCRGNSIWQKQNGQLFKCERIITGSLFHWTVTHKPLSPN